MIDRYVWVEDRPVLCRSSVTEIAHQRAEQCETADERNRFLDTFMRLRKVVVPLSRDRQNLDSVLDLVAGTGPTEEAAMIEALASLRAEGVKL